jgi:hypothetical protein
LEPLQEKAEQLVMESDTAKKSIEKSDPREERYYSLLSQSRWSLLWPTRVVRLNNSANG